MVGFFCGVCVWAAPGLCSRGGGRVNGCVVGGFVVGGGLGEVALLGLCEVVVRGEGGGGGWGVRIPRACAQFVKQMAAAVWATKIVKSNENKNTEVTRSAGSMKRAPYVSNAHKRRSPPHQQPQRQARVTPVPFRVQNQQRFVAVGDGVSVPLQ